MSAPSPSTISHCLLGRDSTGPHVCEAGLQHFFAYLFLIAIAYSSAVISFQKDQVQSHFSLTLTHLENIFDKLPSELFGLQIML